MKTPHAAIGLGLATLCFSTTVQAALTVNDFESGTVGMRSGFQDPYFSGSTTANVLQIAEVPNSARVVDGFGINTSHVLCMNFTWTNASAPGRWVRLTTFYDGFIDLGQPRNPLVPLNVDGVAYKLAFDVYATSNIALAVGIRERLQLTGTEVVAANGGTSGPIELVGAERATASSSVSPGGKAVSAGEWQTLTFDFASDPVFAFTGNGVVDAAWGVFEHLAVSPAPGDTTGEITFYLDNFRVVPVPESVSLGWLGAALISLRRRR